MKTFAERIAELTATREEKSARMTEIMTKSADEGRSTDAAEAEEFDTLESEVKLLDKDIARQKTLESLNAQKAVPAAGGTVAAASESRGGVQVKNTQKLEPGIAFARAVKCLALGHMEHRDSIQIAKNLYDGQDDVIAATTQLVTKAAVLPATTTGTTWAAPLINVSPMADFVEYLRPLSIIGRFGAGGIPGLRRVGFRMPLVGQTSGGDGYWVGETQAKPLTAFDFSSTSILPTKVANIAVASMEVIRDSSPAAEPIIRDQLAAALIARLDLDFINPSKAAVAGVSPASILNGATSFVSSGPTEANIRTDINRVFGAFIAANNAPTSGVWIMPAVVALSLSLMQNPMGQPEYPGLTMNGGTFLGLPVIVSQYVPNTSAGSIVALVNASDIYLADEGGINVDMSTEASLQMDTAPDNPTTATTVLVSLWQRNLVGFRAERTIGWARRRPTAAVYLTAVNWGE